MKALAVHAPVVIIGGAGQVTAPRSMEATGTVDYVVRSEGWLSAVLELIAHRLRQPTHLAENFSVNLQKGENDFGEVLRHELNNPLTGILGNAELLLAEIRRNNDGSLPFGGQQRVETIAALAVRTRETVRQLSQDWESRRRAVGSA